MSKMWTKIAGTLILLGAVEFIIGMILAEVLYVGYSARTNYISDLGVGPSSALVFNVSIFTLGLMVAAGAYFIWRGIGAKLAGVLIFIGGVGAMGVGAFTEDAGVIHGIVSAIAFLFGGLSAIAAYRLQKPPMNYISIIMGLFALIALALFGTRNYLGLGAGGMERMIAYPIVLWGIAFGAHLIGLDGKTS